MSFHHQICDIVDRISKIAETHPENIEYHVTYNSDYVVRWKTSKNDITSLGTRTPSAQVSIEFSKKSHTEKNVLKVKLTKAGGSISELAVSLRFKWFNPLWWKFRRLTKKAKRITDFRHSKKVIEDFNRTKMEVFDDIFEDPFDL